MHVIRSFLLVALAGVVATPVVAQIPSGRRSPRQSAPKLLVANPYVFTSEDSVSAVEAGIGLRDRMDRVVGNKFQVVPREQMNEALGTWGYPADAILAPPVARRFANELRAWTYLTSSIAHRSGQDYTLTARLAGVNDKAGQVVSVAKIPGQSFKVMGESAADLFREPVRAYEDARECMDQMVEDPDKAANSADKAIRRVPSHGLANYCLAQLAITNEASPDSVIGLLRNAVEGDPQSLPAWTDLAEQYEAKEDSANVIASFQQMLLIAPTNQQLRETAIRLFNQYGRPDAAVDIARNGLELDPTNADLWDLLSNAYAVSGNFSGAIDALEQVYQNDSTKADSMYFLKIMVFADEEPDTVRLLKCARVGVDKYPTNINLLGFLAKGYGLVGELDSALTVTTRLLAVDETAIPTALTVTKSFADARRAPEAIPLIDFILANGDDQAKQSAAVILTNGALPLLQEPQDLEGAAAVTRKAIELAGSSNAQLSMTANYVLGIATFLQVPKLDPLAEQ
ncbi:MAG: hypothetical protein HKM89_09935, partial [Gemmatimonadales bacterium]|nr:hypothetical protein [Gemmatimonadales bacterium]